MSTVSGKEILASLTSQYKKVEKLYEEFNRLTLQQTKEVGEKNPDISKVNTLLYQRQAVIEQIESHNAFIVKLNTKLLNKYDSLQEVTVSSLCGLFGANKVKELSNTLGAIQKRLDALIDLDNANIKVIQEQSEELVKAKQKVSLGKKTMKAYKNKPLESARFMDEKK